MPFKPRPLGVQWDAIWTEASRSEVNGNFDTSFDTVWNSRGKVTSRGFVVLIAIPFKSLRFPSTEKQVWGIILYRGIHRKNEDAFWPHDFPPHSGPPRPGRNPAMASKEFLPATAST